MNPPNSGCDAKSSRQNTRAVALGAAAQLAAAEYDKRPAGFHTSADLRTRLVRWTTVLTYYIETGRWPDEV